VKEKKSHFGQQLVQYLGFVIDVEVVRHDPIFMKSLEFCPTPTSASELKSFMGGINFYIKFVHLFS